MTLLTVEFSKMGNLEKLLLSKNFEDFIIVFTESFRGVF